MWPPSVVSVPSPSFTAPPRPALLPASIAAQRGAQLQRLWPSRRAACWLPALQVQRRPGIWTVQLGPSHPAACQQGSTEGSAAAAPFARPPRSLLAANGAATVAVVPLQCAGWAATSCCLPAVQHRGRRSCGASGQAPVQLAGCQRGGESGVETVAAHRLGGRVLLQGSTEGSTAPGGYGQGASPQLSRGCGRAIALFGHITTIDECCSTGAVAAATL